MMMTKKVMMMMAMMAVMGEEVYKRRSVPPTPSNYHRLMSRCGRVTDTGILGTVEPALPNQKQETNLNPKENESIGF